MSVFDDLQITTDVAAIPRDLLEAITRYVEASGRDDLVLVHNRLNEMPSIVGVQYLATDLIPVGRAAVLEPELIREMGL